MNWKVDFSSNALKFLKQNNIEEDLVLEKIGLALKRLRGATIKRYN